MIVSGPNQSIEISWSENHTRLGRSAGTKQAQSYGGLLRDKLKAISAPKMLSGNEIREVRGLTCVCEA
jgi:hypothetical protein